MARLLTLFISKVPFCTLLHWAGLKSIVIAVHSFSFGIFLDKLSFPFNIPFVLFLSLFFSYDLLPFSSSCTLGTIFVYAIFCINMIRHVNIIYICYIHSLIWIIVCHMHHNLRVLYERVCTCAFMLINFLQTSQVKSAASTEKNIDMKSVELQSENRSIKLVSILIKFR